VGLEWDIAPRSLFYANVGTGFKSGGFFVNSASDPLGNSYEPETVTAYTIGIKNRFMDNRLQLNLEAFYLDYADQQVAALDINSSGYIVFPQYNVGGSTIKGVEADIQFLVTPNTRLSLLAQYIDARYRDFQFLSALSNFAPVGAQTACSVSQPRPINAAFTKYLVDCSGRQPLQSPEWSLTAGFQQTIPLANGAEIVANLHTFYETERYTQPNFLPFTVSEGGTRTGLSLTYRTDSWQVSGFVDNIEDRAVVQIAGTAAGSIRQPYAVLRPPRTFGVRLGARF
jgi:iron complex outermembrane receptor protein